MKRNFLLMLLLTLLPLAGWAQTVAWKTSAPDLTYGEATPDFPTLIDVVSGYGSNTCTSHEESITTPTGNNQYNWKIYDSHDNPVAASGTLDAGSYTLKLFIHHQSWMFGYSDDTASLTFSVDKADNNVTGLTVSDYATTETPIEAVCTATFGASTATYKYGKSSTGPWDWSSAPSEAGVFYTQVTIPGTSNYNEVVAVPAKTFKVAGKAKVTGLSLATGLVYNDNNPVTLITGTPTYPSDYDEPHGGIEYIVKTTAGTPAPSETGVAAAEATNVGLYYVYYRVKADGDIYITGNWTPIGSTGVKINKAPFKAEAYGFTAPTADKKTYTGSPLKLFADGAAPAGGTITYSLTAGGPYVDADNAAVKVENVTDATKLYYKVSESEGYLASDELSIDLEMDKATVTFTPAAPAAAAASFTYTQANQTLITDVTPSFGTLLYSIDNGTSWKTYAEVKDQKNAGKYNYKYKVVGNDNYNGVEASIDEIEIKKAQFEVNSTLADAGVVYNGEAQSILTGTIKGGTGMPSGSVTYKVGEETFGPIHSSNPSLVKETNAGEYEVNWSVTAQDADEALNWIPAVGTVSATIAGKEVTLAGIAVVEKNYGETVSNLADVIYSTGWPAGVTTDEAKAAIIADAFTITGAPEKAYPDAGDYNIVLKEKDPDKKTDLSKSYVFTLANPTVVMKVNPVDATLTAVAKEKTYGSDDPEFEATATGLVAGDDLTKIGLSFTREEGTNVGTYAITPASTSKNYNWTFTPANLTIKQKAATVKAKDASKEFGAVDPKFEAEFTGLVGNDAIATTFTREEGEDVGDYVITPAVTKDAVSDNYTFTVETGTLKIGAVMASATAPTPKLGLVYNDNGELQELVNAATDVVGGEVWYSLDGGEWTTYVPKANAYKEGGYEIAWKVKPDANHTEYAPTETVKAAIAKAEVTDIVAPAPAKKDLIYNAADQALVTAAKFDDGIVKGTFEYSLSETGTYTADIPTGFDAGDYTVFTKFIPDNNHIGTTVPSVPVTVAPLTVTYSLTTIDNWEYNGEEVKDVPAALYSLTNPLELPGDDKFTAPFTLVFPEDVTVKDAKDYDFYKLGVKWTNEKKQNYAPKFLGNGKFTITPKALTEKMITLDPASAKFTGDKITVGVTVFDKDAELKFGGKNADVTYVIKKGDATVENGQFTEAGTYNFVFTAANNYKGEITVPFTVGGMDIASMLKVTKGNWDDVVYDGTSQAPEFELSYTKGDKKVVLQKGTDYDVYIWKPIKPNTGLGVDPKDVKDVAFEGKAYTFSIEAKGNYSGKIEKFKKILPKALKAEDVRTMATSAEYTSKGQMPEYKLASNLKGDLLTNLNEGADFYVKIDGVDKTDETKLTDAATYKFKFIGKNNYTGAIDRDFIITPATVLVQAGSYEKFYNGKVGAEGAEVVDGDVDWTYSGLKGDDGFDAKSVVVADGALIVEKKSENVGTYQLAVDATKFSVSSNYTFVAADEAYQGKLTIKKAPVTLGFENEKDKKPFYSVSKVYGAKDSSVDYLAKVVVLENEEESPIATELKKLATKTVNIETGEKAMTFKRATAGTEEVGTYDNDVQISFNAGVFSNYDVTTTPGNFEITKAELTIALTNDIEVVYDGDVPTEEVEAIDPSMITISGAQWDDDYSILEEVKGEIVSPSKNVGTYVLKLTAKAHDYNVKTLDARVIITPAPLTVSIADQTVYVGAKDKDLDMGAATIKGIVGNDAVEAKMVLNVSTAAPVVADKGVKLTIGNTNYQIVEKEAVEAAYGKLIVLAKEDIALDDTKAYTLPEKETTADVTFTTRVVNEDTWNVCVLPFETSPAEISDAFGYAAVDVLDDTRDDGNIHFQIVTSGVIPAGTPFIFKPSKDADDAVADFDEVTFESVKIVKSFADPVTVENGNTYVTDKAGNKFWGTFKSTSFFGKQYWYMTKGAWKDASKFTDAKPVTVKPFRAFVEFVTPAAGRIFIEEPDGTETAIDAIEFNQMVNGEATYTLDGKKVNNVTQKGIYIKDGKKVAVK